MDSIQRVYEEKLDVCDFDSLVVAIEEEAAEIDALRLPDCDELTPFRAERVVFYVGSPGARATCPRCGFAGTRIDGWGGYTCEMCEYTNCQERPAGRQRRRMH